MRYPHKMRLWCLFWVFAIALLSSDAGLDFGVLLVCYPISLVWGLLWLIRLIVYAVRCRRGIAPEHHGFGYWATEPVAFLLALGIGMSGAPSYVRFLASYSALNQYVQSLSVAPENTKPWVGLYAVRETEVLPNHVVRIITSNSGLDDAGYVFSPAAPPAIIGEDHYTKLPWIDGWYHWHRSW